MKTVKLISIALAGVLLVLNACKKDNNKEPESVFKVTPTELSFTKDGGTQELTLSASDSWKAEVDADWCTLSKYEGEKDAFIKVTVEASTSEKETTAVIKFSDTRGNTASVTVKRAGTGVLKVTPTELNFTKDGGTQKLNLSASDSWNAEVDVDWCTLSLYKGDKDALVKVTAKASTSEKETTAVIKFYDSRGYSASVTAKRAGTGEKCKASDYPQVTIGTQVWMAENYRCSKYDTESEAYNASWLTNNTIPTSEYDTYTPYYADASDKSKWAYDDYAGNLTDEQIKKLGYLYNWAAAVGVADGQKQTTAFSGNRQGICPNGWHIPSRAEWQTLQDYIEKTDGKGKDTAGKHLKTTSGWYNGDSYYKPGLDTYGFAALPVGYASRSSVYSVGFDTYFWTATPDESGSGGAYDRLLDYDTDSLYDDDYVKGNGRSVRCLRD